jgi:Bacterial SH3 domain
MLSRKAVGPVVVQVPGPAQDRPSWKRVGVIAAAGFVVGIAWPRLAGVRLGPSLPDGPSAAASAPAVQAAPVAGQGGPSAASVDSGRGPAGVGGTSLAAPASSASPAVAPAVGTVRPNGHATTTATSAASRSVGDTPEGTAQVVWEAALVRDAPTKAGKVMARLARGTIVRLGPSKEGWYRVKYGDGFAGDGWLYRGAIGR